MISISPFIPFGLEIEGQVAKSLGRSGFISRLSKLVEIENSNDSLALESYSKWRVINESTMTSPSGNDVVEVVTPIIRSLDQSQQIAQIWKQLSSLGFEPLPDSGGVHIHLSWPTPNPLELLSYRILVSCLAKDLFELLEVSEARKNWVGTVTDLEKISERACSIYQKMNMEFAESQTLTEATAEEWRNLQILSANPFDQTLNNKRSFLRITSFGTVEIRGMNSTVDFEWVERIKNIFAGLMILARSEMGLVFDNLTRSPRERRNLQVFLETLELSLQSAANQGGAF